MKENSIEEDILNIEKYIELVTEKNYCECNELNEICLGGQGYGSRNVAYSMKRILSDYKKILKENEILKEEKEQAWEEWNNLEQGSYETEQKLKQEIEELIETYKSEKKMKNEYVKLYQDLLLKENVIPIQKIKDKIEEYKNMLKTCNKAKDIYRIKAINERILELQELIEGEK